MADNLDWWRKLMMDKLKRAQSGCSESQWEVGKLHYDGHQCYPQDYVAAARWFRKASLQGYAQAHIGLGICYRNGEGVLKDEVEAYAYFNIAAITEDDARQLLDEMEEGLPKAARLAGQARSRKLMKEIEGHTEE
jgi:TPR repeat protein